jgi:hypothetical protein
MSVMNAMRDFIASMYVKFCSGPTPRYTPPGLTFFSSSGTSRANTISLDSTLSDRKVPSGSEMSLVSFQNSWELRRAGISAEPARPGLIVTTANRRATTGIRNRERRYEATCVL